MQAIIQTTISLHSKMKEIDYVKTLLHELVHLRQWVELLLNQVGHLQRYECVII